MKGIEGKQEIKNKLKHEVKIDKRKSRKRATIKAGMGQKGLPPTVGKGRLYYLDSTSVVSGGRKERQQDK